jgi:peptide chain release factor 1
VTPDSARAVLDQALKKIEELNSALSTTVNHKERAQIGAKISTYEQVRGLCDEILELELVREENKDQDLALTLEEEIDKKYEEINGLIENKQKDSNKNRIITEAIIEIRSGTGGTEAALFANDLMKMYLKYAERNKWKVELIYVSSGDLGSIKSCCFQVTGKDLSSLEQESGVHRVQRTPETEASGRIHTSTASVSILPVPEQTEVEIRTEHLHIDVYRAGGAGGQHVNKTDSAVRITHLPSGIVVQCQDERSQHENKHRAMKVLRAKLFDLEKERQREKIDSLRKTQIGKSERHEKSRTYNYPQNRITDHRFGVTINNLDHVMEGNLDKLVSLLKEKTLEQE